MKKSLLVAAIFAGSIQAAAAEGDAAAGEKVFKKCAACHAVEEGKKKVGPTMFGVFGRPAGSLEGYMWSLAIITGWACNHHDFWPELFATIEGAKPGLSANEPTIFATGLQSSG